MFVLRWAAIDIYENFGHHAILVRNNQAFVATGIVKSGLGCTTFYAFIEELKLKMQGRNGNEAWGQKLIKNCTLYTIKIRTNG